MESGLMMLPQALASGLFMPIGGKLFDRFGARPLVIIGMTLTTFAAFLLSNISADDGKLAIMLPLGLLGAGMGMFMMPLNTHLIQSAPLNLVGRVTSLTNAAQQVMMSFAVAVLTTISTTRMQDLMVAQQKPAPDLPIFADAFGHTFFILIFVAVSGAALGLLLRKPKKQEGHSADNVEVPIIVGH